MERPWLLRVPFAAAPPKPTPKDVDHAELTPQTSASWLSYLTFSWMTPILKQGYVRPLEAPDMYRLPEKWECDAYAAQFERTWAQRKQRANAEKKPSLWLTMNHTVFLWFWLGGLFRLLADVGTITSPLLVKAIIQFASESATSPTPPSIGVGIGMAFGLLALNIVVLILNTQSHYRTFTTGILLRGALIHTLFAHVLSIAPHERGRVTAGKMTSLVSADVSRIDFACGYFHYAYVAPIQMIICLGILVGNLGWSALPGFAFFVGMTPVQGRIIKVLFVLRKRSMKWTDQRISLLQEIFGNMRVIKYFAWEIPYVKRIAELRGREMRYLRNRLVLRSINNALAFALPTLAAVISFITYVATGHGLQPDVIFTSLSLFNLLRMPLSQMPVAFSTLSDAWSAVERIREVLLMDTVEVRKLGSAEEMGGEKAVNGETSPAAAVSVVGGEFTWEPTEQPPPKVAPAKRSRVDWERVFGRMKIKSRKASPTLTPEASPSEPEVMVVEGESPPNLVSEKAPPRTRKSFTLSGIDIRVPRGSLVVIVGPVGAGKSSLLQATIGDMRKVKGEVHFSHTPAYCAQQAWIQNATVRDNILFGMEWDEKKYWRIVKDTCLMQDFEQLPHGDLTEVGERGIALSGGQKQRINIARALYFGSEINIFDDPFSALDAHVGKSVFENVILRALAGKTRILVTHAVHFVGHADWVVVIDDGKIIRQGRVADLGEALGIDSPDDVSEGSTVEDEDGDVAVHASGESKLAEPSDKKEKGERKSAMQTEDKQIGSVGAQVYMAFLRSAGFGTILPLFVLSTLFFQGASVLAPYWLVWWEDDTFHLQQGVYMGIYAVLGILQAFGLFCMGCVFALFTYNVSRRLHNEALTRVIHSPMTFFDTTPLGRIMNRFGKDIDSVDNVVCDAMRMFIGTVVQIVGAIVLVSVILPYFLIAVAVILVFYHWIGAFYRSSAREFKRVDAILRSVLYGHFTEAVSGLATIRAYGVGRRFIKENSRRIDIENRAYWLTVTTQRWLSVRLDFLGSLLVFAVAIIAVASRNSISPSQTGVALSYILVVQQAFAWAVRQSGEVEASMNSVERLLHYAKSLEQEPSYESEPDNKPPESWPSTGHVEIRDLSVRYRPELPPVLKDFSLSIRGGEHVAVVGRTGAGKSTVTAALYRMVDILSGSITLDGLDTTRIGLRDLRSSLSIIPQDPTLFSGTLRSNLDPFGQYNDLTLWVALKQSRLVDSEESRQSSIMEKELDLETTVSCSSTITLRQGQLTLDSPIEEEGTNLSVGQRSLVSIARALVKNSRIVILDEATASVDFATDALIQNTIQNTLEDRTLICIAHRLRTVIAYDRVCVMDAGRVAEFADPLTLFDQGGIFRGMCENSGIPRSDIEWARDTRHSKLS